jgi:hypothetical protein
MDLRRQPSARAPDRLTEFPLLWNGPPLSSTTFGRATGGRGDGRSDSWDRLGQEQLQRGRAGCSRTGRAASTDAAREHHGVRGETARLRSGDGSVLRCAPSRPAAGPRRGMRCGCIYPGFAPSIVRKMWLKTLALHEQAISSSPIRHGICLHSAVAFLPQAQPRKISNENNLLTTIKII